MTDMVSEQRNNHRAQAVQVCEPSDASAEQQEKLGTLRADQLPAIAASC